MERLDSVDYELLVSKEFLNGKDVDRSSILISALSESIQFYTALIKNKKTKGEIQETVDRIKELFDTHQLLQLFLPR